MAPPVGVDQAEAEYQAFIEKNLPRNFAGHFMHGMLGMTGFRIFNSPTFLPAYIHLITAHMPFSDAWVGVGQALQSAGALSPLSRVPAQLATLCESLGITNHGIAAQPTLDLPDPWLSLLTHYHRRKPEAVLPGSGTGL